MKDSREFVSGLKIQLEEAKGREEFLRIQLTKEEGACQNLKLEVEEFIRRTKEENFKFDYRGSSSILDNILKNQRSPNDKTNHGYNMMVEKVRDDKRSVWWFKRNKQSHKKEHALNSTNKERCEEIIQKELQ